MAFLRILVGSTPVGPLGSGVGGGVELTLSNLVRGLESNGHEVHVMAPSGSLPVGRVTHQIQGVLQRPAQFIDRNEVVVYPADGVLSRMWEFARDMQNDFDVILNMAYDSLPFEMESEFSRPIKHLVSMASVSSQMDNVVSRALSRSTSSVAMHSKAQRDTFPGAHSAVVVGSGLDLARYTFVEHVLDDSPIGFIGRIAPEKGLRDAVEVASRTGRELKVWGLLQDGRCWDDAVNEFPRAKVSYQGFLPTDALQAAIGSCSCIVMTPKWVEAFGNVAIEALACGVPVVAYDRGGPAEIVVDGLTGYVVPADNTDAMCDAVSRTSLIDRRACRDDVESRYSLQAFATRVERWLRD